jgi:hypothetical protein
MLLMMMMRKQRIIIFITLLQKNIDYDYVERVRRRVLVLLEFFLIERPTPSFISQSFRV